MEKQQSEGRVANIANSANFQEQAPLPLQFRIIENAPYWTQLRRELINWFNARAPSFKEGYVGAVHLLYNEFPARVHFICHVVRDIYVRLPATLPNNSKLPLPRQPLQVLPGKVKRMVKIWEKYPPKYSKGISSDYIISKPLHCAIEDIVNAQVSIENQPSIGHRIISS